MGHGGAPVVEARYTSYTERGSKFNETIVSPQFLRSQSGTSGTGFGALRIRLARPGASRTGSRSAVCPQVDLWNPGEDGHEGDAPFLRLLHLLRSERDRARGGCRQIGRAHV